MGTTTRMVLVVATMAILAGCGVGNGAGTPTIPTLVNGSFETGDFTGWATQDLTSPLSTLSVQPFAATDGLVGVHTGFDGNGGPGNDRIWVAQDVDLTGIFLVAVRFDWAVPFCDNRGTLDREFRVVIEPAGGGAPLATFPIFVCEAFGGMLPPPLEQPPIPGGGGPVDDQVIDLSGYANQPIRLKFEWFVPEDYTGPAEAYLDDVVLFRP